MRRGTITLAIESRLQDVFLIGLAVNKICSAIPLPDDDVYQLELCVVEAVNNSIEHAYSSEEGHRVEVVTTVDPERIEFQICDSGASMDFDEAHARSTTQDLLSEGGRGLMIMQSFMDEISYTRVGDQNVLTMSKLLPGESPVALVK